MIIEKAYSILEKNPIVDYKPDTHVNWRYFSIKIGNDYYRWIEEYNNHYGYFVRQFMVNENTKTDVKSKYGINEYLNFAGCDSLLGEREFEMGSIFFEYFLKPLGVTEQFIKDNFKNYVSVSFIGVFNILDKAGIKYEVVLNTYF
jgi:hypothetical protein